MTCQGALIRGQNLAVCHLLGHVKKKPSVRFFYLRQKPPESPEKPRILALAAPGNIVRRLPLGKARQFWRFFSIVEKLVERNFHRSSKFLQRLNCWDSVAVFDTRDITTQQTCALLDVALRKLFCFSKQAKPITDYHSVIVYHGRMMSATGKEPLGR